MDINWLSLMPSSAFKRNTNWEFPGGLVVRDPAMSLLWLGFDPWLGSSTCDSPGQKHKHRQKKFKFHSKTPFKISVFMEVFLRRRNWRNACMTHVKTSKNPSLGTSSPGSFLHLVSNLNFLVSSLQER